MSLTKIIVNQDTGQTAKSKLDTAFNLIDSLVTDLATEVTARETLETEYDAHAANTSNPHSVTKTQVGLGNCDNTSDANKPISTAQQNAIDLKQIANAASTLISNLILTPGGDTVGNLADVNKLFYTTAPGASALTLAGGGGTFPLGGSFDVYNDSTSGGSITLTAGGGVTLVAIGGATVGTSKGATCKRIGVNLWVTFLW